MSEKCELLGKGDVITQGCHIVVHDELRVIHPMHFGTIYDGKAIVIRMEKDYQLQPLIQDQDYEPN